MPADLTAQTALVIGATAGIGEGIAVELASRGASVTIAGRNERAGASVVERMRAASPDSPGDPAGSPSFEFRRLDASTLAATRAFATAYASDHSEGLNYLVLCQAVSSFGGRQQTPEGFELKLVLHAYGRILMARDLQTLLRRGAEAEEGAGRVLSVLSGGVHSPYTDWSDPDLERRFSLKRAADAAGFYNDLGFQSLADDPANASIGFLHAAPGFVATSWGHGTKLAFAIKPMQRLFAKSPAACAAIMVDALGDPRYASGFHPINPRGEPARLTKAHTKQNLDAFQAHLSSLTSRALGPEAEASSA
jgi:NAD(P)-dependent dehydrogenase (short-subunit alcohol dehydrogenase family)